MIGALWMVAQLATQTAPPASAPAAPASQVTARLSATPEHAQIGEPVTLVLTVERPSSLSVEPTALEPGVRGAWMFVEPRASRRGVPVDRAGFVVDTTSWSAFALEGDAPLPALEVKWTEMGVEHTAVSQPATVAVAHALAEGEDAPRPPKGFREPIEWTGRGSRLGTAALVLAALVVAAVVAWVVRRRRRRAAPPAAFSALAQLAAIEARPRDDAVSARAGLYDLTRLVRHAVDAHAGKSHAALTDEEWLRWVAGATQVPEGVRSGSRRLLERAERIKYAGETPTRFAVDEALADARAILDALEPDARRNAA